MSITFTGELVAQSIGDIDQNFVPSTHTINDYIISQKPSVDGSKIEIRFTRNIDADTADEAASEFWSKSVLLSEYLRFHGIEFSYLRNNLKIRDPMGGAQSIITGDALLVAPYRGSDIPSLPPNVGEKYLEAIHFFQQSKGADLPIHQFILLWIAFEAWTQINYPHRKGQKVWDDRMGPALQKYSANTATKDSTQYCPCSGITSGLDHIKHLYENYRNPIFHEGSLTPPPLDCIRRFKEDMQFRLESP